MVKAELPSLSELSDDAGTRYGELEHHILKLEHRMKRRAAHIDDSMTLLRDAEEALLKKERIDYDYFGHDDTPTPKKEPSHVVETLAGIVFLYGVDDAGFDLISTQIQKKLGKEEERIAGKLAELEDLAYKYEEFLYDFAVRYAAIAVVGKENIDDEIAVIYCVGKNGKVMFTQANAHQGYSEPDHEEEGAIDEYLSEQKRQEIAEKHAACDHNTYIITHPSDVFDHEMLAIAAGIILQERYFKIRPEARTAFEEQEHIAKVQGLGAIFGAVNEATKDPLGIGTENGDEKPN